MFGLVLKKNAGHERADEIDVYQPIDRCRYVVMDTELTGLDIKQDSIVSLGAVVMEGGRIILGSSFYEIVNPATALTSKSVVVHEITPSEVRTKPTIASVLDDFLKFCEGAVVVGHFLSLDLAFLNKELRRISGRSLNRPVLDTLSIYEWMKEHNGEFSRHYNGADRNKDLFSLARKHHISVSDAHDALMDAYITAQLFQRFLAVLPGLGVRTVKDLLRIGKP